MAIEIVDLPMKNGDFPVRYVNVYRRVSKHGDVKLGDCKKIDLSNYLWDFYGFLLS